MKRVIVFFVFVCLVASFGFSQNRTGNIYGTVVDEAKTPLSGILVTLSGDMIGKMTTITNANGNFKFLSLSPGMYDMKAELEGFATLIQKDIRVELGNNVSLTMTLVPRKLEEQVVVTAVPVAIDQKKTTHVTNLNKEELRPYPPPGTRSLCWNWPRESSWTG